MTFQLMGRKEGMTMLFDEEGYLVPCTLISLSPNVIVQRKTIEKDGYIAVQLGAVSVADTKKKNITKPLRGHFSRAKVEPMRYLFESRLDREDEEREVGQLIGIEYFEGVSHVDVIGISKGKGMQGVIKRHNFSGGPGSHGSGFGRGGGSTGMRSTPGRCLPGVKKPGRMGGKKLTVEGLSVVRLHVDSQVLFVKGAIPGPRGSHLWIRQSRKKIEKKKKKG